MCQMDLFGHCVSRPLHKEHRVRSFFLFIFLLCLKLKMVNLLFSSKVLSLHCVSCFARKYSETQCMTTRAYPVGALTLLTMTPYSEHWLVDDCWWQHFKYWYSTSKGLVHIHRDFSWECQCNMETSFFTNHHLRMPPQVTSSGYEYSLSFCLVICFISPIDLKKPEMASQKWLQLSKLISHCQSLFF